MRQAAKRRANGEGSIRKRSDGRWEGRYTAGHDENGKAIMLKQQQKENEEGWPDSPYLFPSPVTGEMYHPESAVNLHKKILKEAGLEHIRFHDLRHTFATLALQNGVDVKIVSAMPFTKKARQTTKETAPKP